MKVYITGDTHGNPARLNRGYFQEMDEMTKDDLVIIAGDFGMIWDYRGENKNEKYWLDWLEEKPFTTVFCDGNHENFDRLYKYPVEMWHGGKVHRIRKSIIHLMRGQIYDFDGYSFFVFGGARSHDIQDGILDPVKDIETIVKWQIEGFKYFRVNRESWWEEEMPTKEEMEEGIHALEQHNWKCDYVITHSPDTEIMSQMADRAVDSNPDPLTDYLTMIRHKLDYKQWFFGHMHVNRAFEEEKMMCVYDEIVQII